MKKMLVKAVALSLVMGGVGFVANNAQAFSPIEEIQLKSKVDANHVRSMSNQDAINDIKADVATNKTNIQTNANGISDNTIAIQKEAAARKSEIAMTNFKAGLEKQERENADKKLEQKIDKNATDILVEKKNRESAVAMVDNKVNLEKQERENNDAKLDAKIEKETKDREFGEFKLNTKIDAEGEARVANDKLLNTKIDAETDARVDADKKLQNNINAEATTRENAVNALNSRIDQVGSDATKGIAKASALAALHPLDYDPDNKFDIAAAGGFYKGENAFALGAFYRPNRNVMLSMGTTLTSGDNAYNVGLTFKIGKSGKHTEAGLTTADLYAMIGAMQDKMDQQQKKIEELEAKQAK